MVAVIDPVSSTPSRTTPAKPASVNRTVYTPGRRSSMRYWPVASLTVLRTFSISAALDASTVTPGRMAPELSRTVPAIEAWAAATAGSASSTARPAMILNRRRMTCPSGDGSND